MTVRAIKSLLALAALGALACAPLEEGEADFSDIESVEQAAVVCPDGPTIRGIDVSYYQQTINWAQVKSSGIQFAFIRASDGATFQDPKFQQNWTAAKSAGVARGAYQFFRPNQDPIAQADLLLSMMGPLQPGDLPPVIDVEVTGNLPPATVAQKVSQWIARVEGATGRKPIIYTGRFFWDDNVQSTAFSSYPLWHAQYTTNTCPNISSAWSDWHFFQFTDSGSVPGVPGPVDTNYFNGDLSALQAFANPTPPPPPPTGECEAIPTAGATIDDEDACFTAGGPSQYLRAVSGEGFNNGLIWTGTTSSANESNFAQWDLDFSTAGNYKVEVFTDTTYARSTQAKYKIRHEGFTDTVTLNQSAANGWRTLGTFSFSAGPGQNIHLSDNTGEPGSQNIKLAFDAIRVTRVDQLPCGFVTNQTILEEDETCVTLGGPAQYLRAVDGDGHGGSLVWTGTTSSANTANYAQWNLQLAQAGTYKVEVYTDVTYARSTKAKYQVRHNGVTHAVTLNQSAADGWRTVGTYTFAAGGSQYVFLGDNTGEPSSQGVRLGLDAVRITRVASASLVDDGELVLGDEDPAGGVIEAAACAIDPSSENQSAWALLALGLALFLLRRRSF